MYCNSVSTELKDWLPLISCLPPLQEIHSLGSREETEDPAMETQTHSEGEGDGEGGGGGGGVRAEEQQREVQGTEQMETAQPTFWQQVMDPNTNHPYYWNPITNEVCWTLPEGGVISLGYEERGEGEGEGEEASDYYGYYSQAYSGANGGKAKESGPDGGTADASARDKEITSGRTTVKGKRQSLSPARRLRDRPCPHTR